VRMPTLRLQVAALTAVVLCTGLHAARPATAEGNGGSGSAATRQYVTTHRRAILEEFLQLLKIPNVASDQANIRRNADAIVAMMQRRALAPQLLTSSRNPEAPPAVLGEWRVPKAKRTIVLYAHYDGQPVNPAEWATDPFTPTLRPAPLEKDGPII